MRKIWGLIVLVLFLSSCSSENNASGNAVKLEVPSHTFQTGDLVRLDIEITDATDLSGIQLGVTYNANVLQYKLVEEGTFLNDKGSYSTMFFDIIDVTPGEISDIMITRLENTGAHGGGLLASIYFEAKKSGDSDFLLTQMILSDSEGNDIQTVSFGTKVNIEEGTGEITISNGTNETEGSLEFTSSRIIYVGKGEHGVSSVIIDIFSQKQGKITVREVTDTSCTVPNNTIVYKTFEITSDLDKQDIEKANINLKTDKSWISANNIDEDSLQLYDLNVRPCRPIYMKEVMRTLEGIFHTVDVSWLGTYSILGTVKETPGNVIQIINPIQELPLDILKKKLTPDKSTMLIVGISLLVLICGIFVRERIFMIFKRREMKKYEDALVQDRHRFQDLEEHHINSLNKYVNHMKEKGVHHKKIKKNLKKAGWKKEIAHHFSKK